MQSDLVFLKGKMREEEPNIEDLPPPWPWCVEGGDWEETSRGTTLQGARADEDKWRNTHEVSVSVQVLLRVVWGELLQAEKGIKDFFSQEKI